MEQSTPYALNAFIASPRYRIARHFLFWIVHILVFSFIFRTGFKNGNAELLLSSTIWVPVFMLYCYPVMYMFLPRLLLTGRHNRFLMVMIAWAIAGWFLNYLARRYYAVPIAEMRQITSINRNYWAAASYLTMNTMMGVGCTVVLFKHWMQTQQNWMRAEQEKIKAELQNLKAQVHPHFLFNTLNNIYSFALEQSPRTPDLILKLSSLLSYMLYDCRASEVLLEKEIQVMRDYLELEKLRYGNRIDLSVETGGDIGGKWIAPLLMLPFLENAFKHGTSEQVENPWMRFELLVKDDDLRCKIINSKNEQQYSPTGGIGIDNVRKRLNLIYPGQHELKLDNEVDFFAVSLFIKLSGTSLRMTDKVQKQVQEKITIT